MTDASPALGPTQADIRTQADSPTPGGVQHPAIEIPRRARFEVLGAILLALLLGALDQTIVGTALPTIVTDLQGNDYYTWVITAYLLTSTITVPFYGKLSDIYGRKPLLIFGIVLFLVGSALSGLSQTMGQLILFRAIQGLGAGALFPISLAVIGDLFSPQERGKYQGLFGAVFGLAALVGPALGGFITDTLSWHWVFYINLPIGLLSLAVIARVLPSVRRRAGPHQLDYLGGALFTAGLGPFLIGLTNKQTGDWADPAVGGFIVAGLFLLGLFLLAERRAAEPIVPLDLWRDRTYAGSLLASFFSSFAFFGAVVFLPRFFQVVLEESATASGYELFPLLIGVIGSSIAAGQIVARTGKYRLLILVALVGLGVGSLLMTNLTATVDVWQLRLWMFILGLGVGPTLAVFTIVVQNAVPFGKLGVATSNLTFFRQIGGSVALAVAGTIFGTRLQDLLPGQLVAAGVPAQLVARFPSGGGGGGFDLNQLVGVGGDARLSEVILGAVPEQIRSAVAPLVPNLVTGIHDAITLAIASVFWLGVAAAIAAFVAALAIRELPLRSSVAAPAAHEVPHGSAAAAPVALAAHSAEAQGH
jgi:EmrB/QacA subfamily drug resistance transporter